MRSDSDWIILWVIKWILFQKKIHDITERQFYLLWDIKELAYSSRRNSLRSEPNLKQSEIRIIHVHHCWNQTNCMTKIFWHQRKKYMVALYTTYCSLWESSCPQCCSRSVRWATNQPLLKTVLNWIQTKIKTSKTAYYKTLHVPSPIFSLYTVHWIKGYCRII